ncbi:PREDICTED: uncharacterized protein LOC105312704 [Amphimedon queenslandica]|uniref:Aquaporin n=1 Tax=Amphimedon queenslandica TaxID=400682 RepID=A0A1X7UWA0_AMPQE|nr:PREDICTED: uncharacterized protein LOC105312704 [Amphimedon queenslandica]|eukprot:XP_011403863.1 PREDICTED: uncharacterized protein LOC105312704 [Amphimedon queenslandica]
MSMLSEELHEHELDPLRQKAASLLISCLGELFGTWLLTLIICSVVAAAIITEAQVGLWQVALPSGFGVSISIFISAHFSDAHLNPAVSIAFAVVRFRQFHWLRLGPYILSQFLGSLIAGLTVIIFYHGAIQSFEAAHNITRGEPGSQLSGMVFGEYFPNPALYNHNEFSSVTSVFEAFLVEAWGTFILVFVIFSLTHPSNSTISSTKVVVPIAIGITVAVIISIYGPLTQAGLNPARDFGPRVIAALAGWGTIAIPGPRYGFWLYIVGPIIGGVLGGGASDLTLYCFRRFKK